MTSPHGRALLMLAGSELTPSEIRAFARWVELRGPLGLIQSVEMLRQIATDGRPLTPPSPIRGQETELVRRQETEFIRRQQPEFISRSSELAEHLERLLTDGTGLTKSKAAELLAMAITSQHRPGVKLPGLGKTSFRIWLEKVLDTVPDSEMMHLATRIRNQLANRNRPHWPLLKDSDEPA